MAERRSTRLAYQVHLDYTFDRLRAPKLAQVYELLVPARAASGRRAGKGERS